MIRDGEFEDIEAILPLCKEFWKHTIYTEEFEEERTCDMVYMSYQQNLFLILEIDNKVVGFITAIKSPLLASTKAFMGVETGFYITPEYRGSKMGSELILAMEQRAKEQEIKYFSLVNMETSIPEVTDKLYKGLGYSKSESSYTKILI